MSEIEKMSECERKIMAVIWSEGSDPDLTTVTEKVNAGFQKNWKIQTVATFLTRLKLKGIIDIYKKGRYSYYHPILSLDAYRFATLRSEKKMLLFNSNEEMEEFIRSMEEG